MVEIEYIKEMGFRLDHIDGKPIYRRDAFEFFRIDSTTGLFGVNGKFSGTTADSFEFVDILHHVNLSKEDFKLWKRRRTINKILDK